jgi:hypothetical protein
MKNFKIFTILVVILSLMNGLNASSPLKGNDKSVLAFLQGEMNEVSFFLTNVGVVLGDDLEINWAGSDSEAAIYSVDEEGNYEAILAGIHESDEIQKVVYENIYFNIDLVIYPTGNALTYEFIVYPGGNPQDIALTANGGITPEMQEGGEILMANDADAMITSAPLAYQEDITGNKTVINANFNIENEKMSLETGTYEQAQVLTITYTQNVPQN